MAAIAANGRYWASNFAFLTSASGLCASRHRSFSVRSLPREPADPRLRGKLTFKEIILSRYHQSSLSSSSALLTWMTRYISAVLNNLQISTARWRFSTCCKNQCADIGFARSRTAHLYLASASSLAFSLFRSAARSPAAAPHGTSPLHSGARVIDSPGLRVTFRTPLGQGLLRDLGSEPGLTT